ncbi:hypothetical protein [Nocardioides sp.]|uniref:hypothetical protein n=1 Tax=Nocardioides sp. TaxID=35761 RepID=UPI000C8A61CE|nr:hypothetical protein [Nocardioides sp.]MAS55533.1 hypothetical protein [Pimelobacter sp.]MDE0778883.1 hypothetical protein [Nocardioides sp.]
MAEATPHLDIDVDTTETQLTLRRPLELLEEHERGAVSEWLLAHRVDPARVAVGSPIQRDETTSSLSWREQTDDGLVVHRSFPPVSTGERWPAPFPAELLRTDRRVADQLC